MKIPKGVFVYEPFTPKSGWQVDAFGPLKKLLAFKKEDDGRRDYYSDRIRRIRYSKAMKHRTYYAKNFVSPKWVTLKN